MKITDEQIDMLYKFTRQHYVEYYDVQTELVDHLANDIEEIWRENPKLSFEKARDQSFKKFGIFGFMEVVEAREKAMTKRYWKLIWRFTKEWFSIPKIIITISLFLSFFMLFQIPKIEYLILTALGVAILIEIFNMFKYRKQRKAKVEKKEKIFLLESMIGTARNGYSGLTLIHLINLLNISNFNIASLSTTWLAVLAFILTLIIILFHVCTHVLPKRAQELLEETYPEYKIVQSM